MTEKPNHFYSLGFLFFTRLYSPKAQFSRGEPLYLQNTPNEIKAERKSSVSPKAEMATGLGQSGDTGHCSVTSLLCITAATLQSGASVSPHFQNQLNSQWGHTSCLLPFPWSVPMTPWWFSPISSQLEVLSEEAAPACLISTFQRDPMGSTSLPHGAHSPLAGINSCLTLQHSYLLLFQ